MKRKFISKLIAAAVLAATAPAQAEAVDAMPASSEALLPLRDAVTPTRRAITPLPCGLLAIGTPAPRTAAPVDPGPLLAIEGDTVDASRRLRAAHAARASELRVLGEAGALHARVLRIERRTAPLGPIALDTELIVKSRLARAFAAR